MKNKKLLNSPRLLGLRKKKNKIFIIKLLISIIGILFIFIGISFIGNMSELNISQIEVSGNKIVDSQSIKDIANTNLSGKYFGLFLKTNFLLYPKNEIKRELSQKFKILKEITFNVPEAKTLEIKLVEREAKYMWCEGGGLPSVILWIKAVISLTRRRTFREKFILNFTEK